MKPQKKAEKIEKTTGYTLLIVGLILIIVPALAAFAMFLIGAQIPQFVPISPTEPDANVRATAVFSNVCLLFFIFIIIVWAGSIITSRGVTLIKDVKLKLVRKSLREMAELAENEKS
jgi:uncharacterized membrane protein YdbT with pleckstrin-like domain